jgi:hypothetical protein
MKLYEYTADELIQNSNRQGRSFTPGSLYFKSFNNRSNTLFLKVGKYICQIALPDLKLFRKEEGGAEAKVELAVSGDVKVFCQCADYAYRFAYVDTQLSAGIYKETRPANITNPNGDGTVCKHLLSALQNIATFVPEIASSLQSKKENLDHLINQVLEGNTPERVIEEWIGF